VELVCFGTRLSRACLVKALSSAEKTVKAKWIVGADGIHSRVRRWIDLIRMHGWKKIRTEKTLSSEAVDRLHGSSWSNRAQAYVTPLGNDESMRRANIPRSPNASGGRVGGNFPR